MNDASFWIALEHIAIAACIGERDPADAVTDLCSEVTRSSGTSCRLVPGITSRPGPDERSFVVGRPEDGGAGTLMLGTDPPLGTETTDRLVRLFHLMAYAADPFPKSQKIIHRLRNRLAGVLTNIEFVEMVVSEASENEDPSVRADQRAQLLAALTHARRSGRELVELVRELATVDPDPTKI